jgi:hypothetical protein
MPQMRMFGAQGRSVRPPIKLDLTLLQLNNKLERSSDQPVAVIVSFSRRRILSVLETLIFFSLMSYSIIIESSNLLFNIHDH